jgi:hypothetical protein
MAFTKKLFGTTAKKFLFGAGLGAVFTTALTYFAPQWANSTIVKAGEAALSYSVGGIESAIGTVATTMLTPTMTRGSRALDNTMTESL